MIISFWIFSIYLFNYFTAWSKPPPSSPPSPFLMSPYSYSPLPLLLRKGEDPKRYQPTLESQGTVWLNEFSLIEDWQDSPAKGKQYKGRQQSQRQPLLTFLGDPHAQQPTHLLHMCRGPRYSPCILFGWLFSLCEHPWAQVSLLCRSSCGVLDPTISFSSSCYSSSKLLSLAYCLAVDLCISFLQLLGQASQKTVMLGSWPASIAEYN